MLSYSKREMQAERRKMPQFPKFEQHSRIVPGPERIRESVLIKEGGNSNWPDIVPYTSLPRP